MKYLKEAIVDAWINKGMMGVGIFMLAVGGFFALVIAGSGDDDWKWVVIGFGGMYVIMFIVNIILFISGKKKERNRSIK